MVKRTMKKMTRSIKIIGSISLLILALNSQASDLTIPNQFASGTRAVAADVNANFDAAAVSVTDNQTQITDLLTRITTLTESVNALAATVTGNSATISTHENTIAANQTTIEALEAENTDLQMSIDALEADAVVGLASVLSVGTDNQGNTAAIFSGVNLHVNNGTGERYNVNGLGNFIIGYDEVSGSAIKICASGFYTDQASCENAGSVWSDSHKSGSHNLIVGAHHNYSSYGAFIAGQNNSVNRQDSSVLGGTNNLASGVFSVVSGGTSNTASAQHSSVDGGSSNIASGIWSSVSGGLRNTATGFNSSVSGGFGGLASGKDSSVTGGFNNIASGPRSSVSGGSTGEAPGNANWVAGTLFEDD